MKQLLHLVVLLFCCCCWNPASVSGTLFPDGQEPWLVVWKKGIDGEALWRTLCPTVSTGENTMFSLSFDLEDMGPDALRSLKSREQRAQQLVLNCSTRFTQLFNGFAGHFTLKELEIIKAQYKHSIDFAISDRAIQVDSPPDLLHAQQQNYAEPFSAAEPYTEVSNATATEANPGMLMDFPTGPHARRQLLFTPPPELAKAAKRRMLPEEYNATWGLDMLDQGYLPLDSIYHYTYNGTGVHAYILDTGIRTTHEEFVDPVTKQTRAFHGFDAVYNSNSSEDCHGHGSHVAAVVGGKTFGVAKNITLHAVRVLACDGTAMVSALLKGLEWVAKHHIKPAIVHMSIEGGFSSVVNQAVEQLIKIHHVHVVVSSGNSGKDACLASPASAPSAVTVAAIDDKLARWAYANWGACVDVFAPGVAILSAVSNEGDSGTAFKTGTSMAAPFVTGVVATYLETHPGASPEEVQQKLYQSALRGSVTDDAQGFATLYPGQYPDLLDISSTPNRLLRANLTRQALLSPGRLYVSENTTDPLEFNIRLSSQPSSNVTVNMATPPAWDGSPRADLAPSQLQFTPETWDQPQVVAVVPRPVSDGDYYIKMSLQGPIVDGFPATHTVLVTDSRRRSGESAAMARVISKLPFNDTGDTTGFGDNYRCQATDAAADVVYSYTPALDTDVTISTCGSGFDTKLLVSTNLSDPSTYMCNDDDRSCVTNTACSRLDVSFEAGTTYYIVIDGYSGASGEYSLTVTCNTRCPGQPGGSADSRPNGGPSPAASSPSSSTMLIQALLHLSRNPTSSSTASPVSLSPSPSLPPSPAPPRTMFFPGPMVGPIRPQRGKASQPAATPSSLSSPPVPIIGPGSTSSTGPTSQPGTAAAPVAQAEGQPVKGPLGTLLAANLAPDGGAGVRQLPSQPAASPADVGDAGGGHAATAGPLSVIQASSREMLEQDDSRPSSKGRTAAGSKPGNRTSVRVNSTQPTEGAQSDNLGRSHGLKQGCARHTAGTAADSAGPVKAPQLAADLGGVSISPGHARPQGASSSEQDGPQTAREGAGLQPRRGQDGRQISPALPEENAAGSTGSSTQAESSGKSALQSGVECSTDRISVGLRGRRLGETQAGAAAAAVDNDSVQQNEQVKNDVQTGRSINEAVEQMVGWDIAEAQLASLTLASEQQLPVSISTTDEE